MRVPAGVLLFAAGALLTGCGAPPGPPAPAPAAPVEPAPGAAARAADPAAPIPPGAVRPTKAAPPVAGAGLQFLHATVVTREGKSHTGVLRWGGEEAFWDDLLHGQKMDLPYADRQPEADRPHTQITFVGFLPIGVSQEGESGRQFAARFADISEIRPLEGDAVELTMKSGTKYRLEAGFDIGADLHLDDPASGAIDLNWRSIERIVFQPASAHDPEPRATRLFGKVATAAGTFTGFIMWDGEECLSTDHLDGDTAQERLSLEMGSLRAIEKLDGAGARVETEDGRVLELRGTNDVDSSIRGILVEDPRYGRVRVSWEAFKRVDFLPAATAGRRYEDYPSGRSLRGTVTDRDGRRWPGRVVFDLDESETWEMLDGMRQGVRYHIPFDSVRALEPLLDKTTRVTLRNGESLALGETQDVSDKNAGVLILDTTGPSAAGATGTAAATGTPAAADAGHYVPWRSVARIDLD